MENSIECIAISDRGLPLLSDCDTLTAAEDFWHMDRIAEFNVLIYVTAGTMYVTENGCDYAINPGELLFLKSGLRHFGRHPTLRGTRWIYAHFRIADGQCGGNTAALPKKICGLSGSTIEEKLFRLCEYFHSPAPLRELRQNSMLYEILLDIASEQYPEQELISDRICAFLDGQTGRDYSKELISGQFYQSYSSLAARFRMEKGMTMGQYHNSARMKRACHLLRSTLMVGGGDRRNPWDSRTCCISAGSSMLTAELPPRITGEWRRRSTEMGGFRPGYSRVPDERGG